MTGANAPYPHFLLVDPASQRPRDRFQQSSWFRELCRSIHEAFDTRKRRTFVRIGQEDEIALNINFMGQSGHSNSSSLHAPLQDIGLTGTNSVWPRMDLGSKCFRASAKGGPSWKDVEAKVTLDALTGHVIKIETAKDISRACEHCPLPGGPCDIVTSIGALNSPPPTFRTAPVKNDVSK